MFAQELTENTDPITDPFEKIYIQTDKSAYISGERIWLRAHLVDAATNRPAFLSRYIYIELFNPFNELMKRVKIRPDSLGAYSGHINLEEDLAEGNYTLRAYTRYMRNQGNQAFFRKTITVLDPYSLQVETIPVIRIDKDRINVNFRFVDRTSGDTIAPEIVTVKLFDETTRTLAPRNGTNFRSSISLSKSRSNNHLLLGIVNKGRIYNRFFALPYAADDFEVSFHPEGGYLIPGKRCRVGFKAINPSGLGEIVSGIVYNSKNEEVARMATYKLGMGLFDLLVDSNETYYAVCETKNGAVKQVVLPTPEPRARIVSVRRTAGRVVASLLKGESASDGPISLLVHNKGNILYHEPWSAQTNSYAFSESSLPTGITSFTLLGSDYELLSERLIFNWREEELAQLEFKPSSSIYTPREKICLNFQLSDIDTITFYNNFAISVTDKNKVALDTSNNLVSTLLLSSELKGHIESPATYIASGALNQLALDALMTTQGWSRYDISSAIKGKAQVSKEFEPEQYQEINGTTEALLRSMKDGEVSLIATLDTLLSTLTTAIDENGRFHFKVEYPDGTAITVQSLSKKGSRSNLIHIDPVTFPDNAHATLPAAKQTPYSSGFDQDAYLKKANDEYSMKHGIRTIMLDEVTVTAPGPQRYKESKFYSPISATGLVTADEIEKRKVSSLRSLLVSTSGIIVKSDRVTTTRSDLPVLFVIDNNTYEDFFDQLDRIDVSSIDNLFIMKDNTFMLGYFPNTSGAVVITTKSGFVQKNTLSRNINRIQPLGYQQPVEFYSPKYETREELESPDPDFRTTIYWNPNVQFSREGNAVVEFYSADTPTTYQVVGEGINGLGKLIRFTKEIVVESNSGGDSYF